MTDTGLQLENIPQAMHLVHTKNSDNGTYKEL